MAQGWLLSNFYENNHAESVGRQKNGSKRVNTDPGLLKIHLNIYAIDMVGLSSFNAIRWIADNG